MVKTEVDEYDRFAAMGAVLDIARFPISLAAPHERTKGVRRAC